MICRQCLPEQSYLIQVARCIRCHSQISFTTQESLCAACETWPLPYNHVRFLWDYSETRTKDLIQTLKYKPSLRLAKFAGEILANHGLPLFTYRDWDMIIPIPISYLSLKKREFNQCQVMAQYIFRKLKAEAGKVKISYRALRHQGSNSRQALLAMNKRIKNVRNAFNAKEKIVANKRILLIEDVITSGATIYSAANELYKGGAAQVDILALARSEAWNEWRGRITSSY